MTLMSDYYPELSANVAVDCFHILFHLFIQTVILLPLWSGIKWYEDSDLGTQ